MLIFEAGAGWGVGGAGWVGGWGVRVRVGVGVAARSTTCIPWSYYPPLLNFPSWCDFGQAYINCDWGSGGPQYKAKEEGACCVVLFLGKRTTPSCNAATRTQLWVLSLGCRCAWHYRKCPPRELRLGSVRPGRLGWEKGRLYS